MTKPFTQHLIKTIPSLNVTLDASEICLHIALCDLKPIMCFLKYHTQSQYKLLTDICIIDYPTRVYRHEVIYTLLSIRYNSRIKVKMAVHQLETIPSIANIYKSADWWERESWDMFGTYFTGHPDLRRLLSDYGFEGHPLNKNFPLSGYTEVRYSETQKRVIYETIQFPQSYRSFKFQNP